MPSNKITYTFIAIDKFSQTANKIAASINKINNSVKKVNVVKKFSEPLIKGAKDLKKFDALSNTTIRTTGKLADNVKSAGFRFSKFTDKISNSRKQLSIFTNKFDKWSDQFGMSAYFRAMNVIFPMMIVAKMGLKYADAMDSANVSTKSLFGNIKNYAKYQTQLASQASKMAFSTPFGTEQIAQSQALIAKTVGNIAKAPKLMQDILKVAASQGIHENLAAFTKQTLQGILSGNVSGIQTRFLGASGKERIGHFQEFIAKHQDIYDRALKLQTNTITIQMNILGNAMEKVSGTMMMTMTPSVKGFNNILKNVTPRLNAFIKSHKAIMGVIFQFSLFAIGMIGLYTTVGMVVGAIGLASTAMGALASSAFLIVATIGAVVIAFKHQKEILDSMKNFGHSLYDKGSRAMQIFKMPFDIKHPIQSLKTDWGRTHETSTGYYHRTGDMLGAALHGMGVNMGASNNVVNLHVHNQGAIDSTILSDSPNNIKLNVVHSSRNLAHG